MLLLQNEINLLRELMEIACEKGMKVVLNPSPMNENVTSCDLSRVSLFILNELEAGQLVGETEPEQMIAAMRVKYPEAATVLTLGKAGSIYADGERVCRCPCFPVEAVDTTAAGDTFAGYYLTAMLCGREVGECLRTASAASALAVTKRGAAPSIPYYKDVEEFLRSR
ncbi:ribokinase [Lachnospiraceae bacterium]|nr:ribokinase [Lachnospiraceae bacterium]